MILYNMAGLFKKIFKADIFKKSSSSVLGVDIGSSAIKLVQLRKEKGSAVLETYGELALGPYGDLEIGRSTNLGTNKIAEALTDLLREANVTTVRSGFSIPFASSLLMLIQMPSVGTRALNKMIPIEARKYIPVPISEVMLDWFIIPKDEKRHEKKTSTSGSIVQEEEHASKTDVLLVAIHNEVLNNYNSLVEEAKLTADFFEIEIFSTLRATVEQNLAPIMVLDIGAAATKVYIVEYGIVRVSHAIRRGSQDVTMGISKSLGMSVEHAEEIKRKEGIANKDNKEIQKVALLTLDYIFSEANRVLLSYQKKQNKNVSKVVLTGGGAVMKGIIDLARKHLETNVTIGDPFARVDTPAFLEDVLKEAGPEFTVAVGLALRKLHELDQ